MTGDERKKRDPIFSACFVIFILAAVSVVGAFVNEHYLTEDETKAAYGDSVEVEYVGTFYDYYGSENSVVFDTSYSSIGKDDSVVKSNAFDKSSYSTLKFTVGGTDVLKDFGYAVVGHKVGDKVRVMIEDAYPAGSEATRMSTSGLTIPLVQEMTKAQFTELYGDVNLGDAAQTAFKTVYGWDALAYLDTTQNMVVVTNMPNAGETYKYDSEDGFADVSFNVTSTQNGVITYNLALADYKTVDSSTGEIQMVEVDFGTETWYITNYTGSSFTYKTCEEVQNQTLYFEIEIVSIN